MKSGIMVEKISNSSIRILFDAEQYSVIEEISKDPAYYDRFIGNQSANVDLSLAWAGIIKIDINPLLNDAEFVDDLTERVINDLELSS